MRKQRGLTQAQLGHRLGIGQVRIAEIEAKPGLVNVDQLVKLLSALGATLVLRELVRDEPVPPPAHVDRAQRPSAKKTSSVPGKTRRKTASLRIPPKKGSW